MRISQAKFEHITNSKAACTSFCLLFAMRYVLCCKKWSHNTKFDNLSQNDMSSISFQLVWNFTTHAKYWENQTNEINFNSSDIKNLNPVTITTTNILIGHILKVNKWKKYYRLLSSCIGFTCVYLRYQHSSPEGPAANHGSSASLGWTSLKLSELFLLQLQSV